MFIYDLAWSWFEDYCPNILTHSKKYSRKEFADICREAIRESVSPLLNEDDYIGLNNLCDVAVELLKSKYGFTEPTIITYSLWGASIIKEEDSQKDYGGKECAKDILGAELFDKIVKHNVKIDKRI